MIKLVVADFDGTLLPYGNKMLSDKTRSLIKELLDRGVRFAVASGRTYSELFALVGELSEKLYFICDDGAVTVKGGKVLYKKPFPKETLNTFLDEDIFRGSIMYSLDKAYVTGNVLRPVTYDKTPKRITRAFEIQDDIFKVVSYAKTFTLTDSSDYRVHYSDKELVEFVSPFANKGVALGDLQLHLGVNKFDTVAIGDAANDIPMMHHAKYSYSIGSRSKELADVCRYNANTAEEVLETLVSEFKKTQKQHKTT